jgi:ubiquinone/menaquinone biosynthesis C-methylase UbiE
MDNQAGYNQWAGDYDAVINKTRDLEALAFRETISQLKFDDVLELGCGTGKNTEWLAANAKTVIAIDFSDEMVNKAREKINQLNIQFLQGDINAAWEVTANSFDLLATSLVLEHISNLDHIFDQAATALRTGGFFYIGELHPYKQYQGSKARYESGGVINVLECFTHHMSDYFNSALSHGFSCHSLSEYFDEGQDTPRLLVIVFRRK